MNMDPETAARYFTRLARNGETICRHEEDGSMRVVVKPQRRSEFDWHTPKVTVPPQQWRPETGITRYEFARRMTPLHQLPIFKALQAELQANPPRLAPKELFEQAIASRDKGENMANGLPGLDDEDSVAELHELLNRYVLRAVTPDGQWRFTVQAVRFGQGQIADRLDVRHRDYRTLADWDLLIRLRSWCLNDDREAFIYAPGQDIHADDWEHCYENATPNNLVWIAPRYNEAVPSE